MNQNEMMLNYLMQMGALNQEGEEQSRRQAQIDALRKSGRVDTGMQGAGRMQVAASPWAHLSNAVNDVQAGYQQRGLDAERKQLGNTRMDKLRQMMEQQQAARQQPAMPGMPANADAQAFRDMTGGLI